MIKIVDKANGYVVQKVIHNKTGKTVRYQAVRESKIGDTNEVQCFETLTEARTFVETIIT